MNKKYLGKTVAVTVDRQMGTKHPKHDFYYPINYGYIKGTVSGDGEELDAYVLGIFKPLEEFSGKVIAIIHRTNDDDDKLVVAPEQVNYTDEQILGQKLWQHWLRKWKTSEMILLLFLPVMKKK